MKQQKYVVQALLALMLIEPIAVVAADISVKMPAIVAEQHINPLALTTIERNAQHINALFSRWRMVGSTVTLATFASFGALVYWWLNRSASHGVAVPIGDIKEIDQQKQTITLYVTPELPKSDVGWIRYFLNGTKHFMLRGAEHAVSIMVGGALSGVASLVFSGTWGTLQPAVQTMKSAFGSGSLSWFNARYTHVQELLQAMHEYAKQYDATIQSPEVQDISYSRQMIIDVGNLLVADIGMMLGYMMMREPAIRIRSVVAANSAHTLMRYMLNQTNDYVMQINRELDAHASLSGVIEKMTAQLQADIERFKLFEQVRVL